MKDFGTRTQARVVYQQSQNQSNWSLKKGKKEEMSQGLKNKELLAPSSDALCYY